MSEEIKTFFRACPACGRRFQIQLVNKQLVNEETVQDKLTPAGSAVESALIPATSPLPTYVGEGETIIVDIEEFRYSYKCKHCGHQWSEIHDEERAGKVVD